MKKEEEKFRDKKGRFLKGVKQKCTPYFKKGHEGYGKGKTFEELYGQEKSEEYKKIMSKKATKRFKENPKLRENLKKRKNAKNPNWKGDDVGYIALHDWVRRRKIKPKFCERCKKNPPRDLANISGEYKRDIDDYWYLCRKCHVIEDGNLKLLIASKRMICVICKNKIVKDKENYFRIVRNEKGKVERVDFSHVNCWQDRNNFDSSLRNLIGGVTNYAKEQGIIKEDIKEDFILA